MSDKLLSTRHLRFVREYFKDGNGTQAYIRAGYSRRSAQSCASRLLTQPHIAAAIAGGRQRLARPLEVHDHSKQEKRVAPRLRRPEPATMAQDRERYAARCPSCDRALDHGKEEHLRLEQELNETRVALAAAQATIDAAGLAAGQVPCSSAPRRSADAKP